MAVARLQSSYILFANLMHIYAAYSCAGSDDIKRKIDKSLWSFTGSVILPQYFSLTHFSIRIATASFSGRHMVHGRMCSSRTAELFWLSGCNCQQEQQAVNRES